MPEQTKRPEITENMRAAIELAIAAQSAFWTAMSDLERETGIEEIDGNQDLEGMTVENLFDQYESEDTPE